MKENDLRELINALHTIGTRASWCEGEVLNYSFPLRRDLALAHLRDVRMYLDRAEKLVTEWQP